MIPDTQQQQARGDYLLCVSLYICLSHSSALRCLASFMSNYLIVSFVECRDLICVGFNFCRSLDMADLSAEGRRSLDEEGVIN